MLTHADSCADVLSLQQLLARLVAGSSRAAAAAEALQALATRADEARLAMVQGHGVVGPVLQVRYVAAALPACPAAAGAGAGASFAALQAVAGCNLKST